MDFEKDRLHYIIILLLLQSFLLLVVTTGKETRLLTTTPDTVAYFFLFIVVGISILSIIMVRDLYKFIKHKTESKIRRVKLEEKEKLINSLRSQKHDFSNHLQTIYGMIQLGKEKEVKDYIQSLNKELNQISNDKDGAEKNILESILIPMQEEAMEEGLNFVYQVDKGVQDVNCSLNKLFRIVSNLSENAIEATKEFNGDKNIEIMGVNKVDYYVISVYNSGPAIKKELLDELFTPGKSTKGEERGFGLYIIKSLVEEIGGEIEVKSEVDFGTKFICYLPKK